MNISKFLKINCPKCGHEIIVYGKATTKVKCPKCGYLLIKNKGGKAKVRASIKKVYAEGE